MNNKPTPTLLLATALLLSNLAEPTDSYQEYRFYLIRDPIDACYEDLIDDQESESRRIIDFLDLEWQPAILDFHNLRDPSTTASAVPDWP